MFDKDVKRARRKDTTVQSGMCLLCSRAAVLQARLAIIIKGITFQKLDTLVISIGEFDELFVVDVRR